MARRRHLARIAVMQVLFELERREEVDPIETLQRNMEQLGGADAEFAESLLEGVLVEQGTLETVIQEHAPEWSPERMDPISRAVLLVGAFELLHTDDVPPAVVMNEAIDIAKEYASDESGKFVNGVLNAIAKK